MTDRPNILFILDDQHRIDCLGAYGNAEIRTPNIDRIAAGGVRYDNSFCAYPVCTPSRYSIVSGLYVHEHRGYGNYCTLPPQTATFPAILRGAGYRTRAVGKMHYTPTYLDVGFDEMFLAEQNGPGRWDDDYHRYLREHGQVDRNDLEDQERPWRDSARDIYWESFGALTSNLSETHHSTTWIGDRAIEAIEQWQGGGNLLFASFIKPHHPFDPPAPWDAMYDPDELTLLPGWMEERPERDRALSKGYFPFDGLTEPAARRAMAMYYATVSQIDHQVGRMLEALDQKGLYNDTLVVFTSDHGDYLGYHRMLLKGNYAYEPLIKVPLIIKFPGDARAGTASDALVSNVDLAPTLIRQAGCKPAAAMSGLDLSDPRADRPIVFAEAVRGRHVMARTRTHKLIASDRPAESVFFDLEADPHERTNLYDDPSQQSRVAELHAAIREWRGDEVNIEPYLDEDAPQIQQPNVPARDDGHRDEIIAYYTEVMEKEPR